jgi:hypothetical protein
MGHWITFYPELKQGCADSGSATVIRVDQNLMLRQAQSRVDTPRMARAGGSTSFIVKRARKLQQRAQGHRADTYKTPSRNSSDRVAPFLWTLSGDSVVQTLLLCSQAPLS